VVDILTVPSGRGFGIPLRIPAFQLFGDWNPLELGRSPDECAAAILQKPAGPFWIEAINPIPFLGEMQRDFPASAGTSVCVSLCASASTLRFAALLFLLIPSLSGIAYHPGRQQSRRGR